MSNDRREDIPPKPADADHPSPTSPEHQFDWPGLGSQHQQMQTYEDWVNVPNANLSFHQNTNQQPFSKPPDFDKSRMTWPMNSSYNLGLPTEDKDSDSKPLKSSTD
jgi:hypothetical protein